MYYVPQVVLSSAARVQMRGDDCFVDPANWKLGLVMYASYFILFVILFHNKYFPSVKQQQQIAAPCMANMEGSGFFHGPDKDKAKRKPKAQ